MSSKSPAFGSVLAPWAFASNKKLASLHLVVIFDSAQEHKFINHKRPIKATKPFALSLFGRSVSFHNLFYKALLS